MLVRGETYVDKPRVDGTEHQVVFLVGIVNFLVVVQHPPQLDGREVSRQWETSASIRLGVHTKSEELTHPPVPPCPFVFSYRPRPAPFRGQRDQAIP